MGLQRTLEPSLGITIAPNATFTSVTKRVLVEFRADPTFASGVQSSIASDPRIRNADGSVSSLQEFVEIAAGPVSLAAVGWGPSPVRVDFCYLTHGASIEWDGLAAPVPLLGAEFSMEVIYVRSPMRPSKAFVYLIEGDRELANVIHVPFPGISGGESLLEMFVTKKDGEGPSVSMRLNRKPLGFSRQL
jgi:hypothetical protein